jgi:hypothetical protein
MYQYAIDKLCRYAQYKSEIMVVKNGKEKIFSPLSYSNRSELLYAKALTQRPLISRSIIPSAIRTPRENYIPSVLTKNIEETIQKARNIN